MGRTPCCKDVDVKRGPWTTEEDKKLTEYIGENGVGSWRRLPELAGLNRCGKSCRLRWTNYLRPDIKRGRFSEEEEKLIIDLHSVLGNKWSSIATRLPGRTDNEIKNYWNTHLRKKLLQKGIDPVTHRPRTDLSFLANLPSLLAAANLSNLTNQWNNALQLQADAAQLLKLQLARNLIQVLTAAGSTSTTTATATTTTTPNMDLMAMFGSPSLIGGYQPSDLQLPGLVPLSLQSSVPMASGSVSCLNSELLASLSMAQPATAPAATVEYCCSSENTGMEMSSGCSSALPASDNTSVPSLVSGSPETTSQVEQVVSGDDPMFKEYSTISSTLFESWDLCDPDGDESVWKEILEQMAWSNAP